MFLSSVMPAWVRWSTPLLSVHKYHVAALGECAHLPRSVCPNHIVSAVCPACRRGDGAGSAGACTHTSGIGSSRVAMRQRLELCATGASTITMPRLGTVTGGRQAEVGRFRHVSGTACRSSVQVNGQDRWDEASSGRPEGRGKAVDANQVVLKITRPRPSFCCTSVGSSVMER